MISNSMQKRSSTNMISRMRSKASGLGSAVSLHAFVAAMEHET